MTPNFYVPSQNSPSRAFQTPQFTSSTLYEDQADVVLIFLPKYEKELLQSVRILRTSQGDVDLADVLQTLKSMGFPITKNVISYYSQVNDMYVYIGNDPVPRGSVIPALDVVEAPEGKQITIRIRQILSDFPLAQDQMIETDNVKMEGSVVFNPDGTKETKQKRTKERKIGEILDKVLQWRKLYTGVCDPATGQTVKMSLEEAAQRVGISKKSLDDYLLQIRFGKKYGFNFNDHFNEKVGILRTFVKKHKGKIPTKVEEGSDDLSETFEDGKDSPNVKIEAGVSKKSKKIQKSKN